MVRLLKAVVNKTLDQETIEIDERSATTVMAVSGGYPEAYEKGKPITGLDTVENSIVFHAGTTQKEGKVVTSGGRVLAVTSYGEDHKQALAQSYQELEKLSFEGIYYRKDLGFDL